jgi:hypothetical protein
MPDRTRNKLKADMFELLKDHTLQLKGDTYDNTDEVIKEEPEDDNEPPEEDSTEGDGDDLDDEEKDMAEEE